MLEYKSYLEDTAPTVFVVPDLGAGDAVGILTHPDGRSDPVQVTGATDPGFDRYWAQLDRTLPGVVFVMPVFTVEGDYVLTVTQSDDAGSPLVITYLIHVLHDPERYTPGA